MDTIDDVHGKDSGPERKEVYDVIGTQMQFLIAPEPGNRQTGMIRTLMPAGSDVPLHNHPEPETFFLLKGELQVYVETGPQTAWHRLTSGCAISVAADDRHALRNTGSSAADFLVVAPARIYDFFRELARPVSDPPKPPGPDDMQRFFEVFQRFGFCLAPPEKNAAIGIAVPPSL